MTRRTILTPDVLETIPLMVKGGMKRDEIAAKLGCTMQTLQVQCSRRGISLRRGGPRPPPVALKMPKQASLTLTQKAMTKLQARAFDCGLSEETLASALLEVIAIDDLFDAVLDVEEEVA